MTEKHATIRGASLAYDISGAGSNLIWGHGLSQTRANESALGLLDWSRIPVRALRYDARGHGLSETTPDPVGYSWKELALDQQGLADHVGMTTYIAAGASMGCGTALHVAVQAPSRISGLVLVTPPTGWETRAAQTEQWELAAQVIETEGVESIIAARATMAPPDPLIGDIDRTEQQNAATRGWDSARLAQVMRGATTANLPSRELIATISIPTLILAWTGDPVHPTSTADELKQLLPHAELHVASTKPELERWTDLVATFVSDVPG